VKQQRRERIIKRIREQWKEHDKHLANTAVDNQQTSVQRMAPNVSFEESDPLPKTLPEVQYHISNTTRLQDNIYCWVDCHEQNHDEAIKVNPFNIIHLCESNIFLS
jgi:hypothetical protein